MLFRKLFKRKQEVTIDNTEYIFTTVIDLVKNLSRADYNRLKKAMDLGYDSYQLIRNVKTNDERELMEVTETEKKSEMINQLEEIDMKE